MQVDSDDIELSHNEVLFKFRDDAIARPGRQDGIPTLDDIAITLVGLQDLLRIIENPDRLPREYPTGLPVSAREIEFYRRELYSSSQVTYLHLGSPLITRVRLNTVTEIFRRVARRWNETQHELEHYDSVARNELSRVEANDQLSDLPRGRYRGSNAGLALAKIEHIQIFDEFI